MKGADGAKDEVLERAEPVDEPGDCPGAVEEHTDGRTDDGELRCALERAGGLLGRVVMPTMNVSTRPVIVPIGSAMKACKAPGMAARSRRNVRRCRRSR